MQRFVQVIVALLIVSCISAAPHSYSILQNHQQYDDYFHQLHNPYRIFQQQNNHQSLYYPQPEPEPQPRPQPMMYLYPYNPLHQQRVVLIPYSNYGLVHKPLATAEKNFGLNLGNVVEPEKLNINVNKLPFEFGLGDHAVPEPIPYPERTPGNQIFHQEQGAWLHNYPKLIPGKQVLHQHQGTPVGNPAINQVLNHQDDEGSIRIPEPQVNSPEPIAEAEAESEPEPEPTSPVRETSSSAPTSSLPDVGIDTETSSVASSQGKLDDSFPGDSSGSGEFFSTGSVNYPDSGITSGFQQKEVTVIDTTIIPSSSTTENSVTVTTSTGPPPEWDPLKDGFQLKEEPLNVPEVKK